MTASPDAVARVLTPVPPAKPSSARRLAELGARIPDYVDLILLGDSLAAAWPSHLQGEAFPGRRVLNLGLPGDRIQNTLWRLRGGETAHLRPRELVLLLGTNNLGDGDPPDAIAAGLAAVLRRALSLWTGARPLVVTVPRRGEPPGFREADRLALNAALAAGLAGLAEAAIVDADAALAATRDEEPSLMPDRLHISREGYVRLSRAMRVALG
ncbi:GDSL-type esterase/lipase family protein [Enterovirga aerilata]|uniref:GDSL family lipase n=1 Tax=Enterovirga aerilata TaxID=2730920 RepID=A0A849I530_9HYPH|nr:GDSL-type esterase/lipase family protein [Enterovirga sp. DB1703]NNM74956.1 GDSL family lipase [Enterovirga sp. DB1703]